MLRMLSEHAPKRALISTSKRGTARAMADGADEDRRQQGMDGGPESATGPVTVIATRRVVPGHEARYEAWLADIQAETQAFPGYLGVHVVRPAEGSPHDYTSILKFSSLAALRAWEESDARRAWLMRLPREAVVGDAHLERKRGLALWVTPGSPRAPVRWKMAVVVIVVVYALILILSPIVAAIAPTLPFRARLFASVVIEVLLMTYVVMPRVTAMLGGWLYPEGR
jgi:uncharacterized protein